MDIQYEATLETLENLRAESAAAGGAIKSKISTARES
jgi:hypothetical protein